MKELTKPRNSRQLIWQILRNNRECFFSVDEIAEETGCVFETVYIYLRSLYRGGFLEIKRGSRFSRRMCYRLLRDAGVEAPRLREDGSACSGTATEAMWRTMKILKQFDIDILVAHVRMTHKISRKTANQYTLALERAGYLANIGTQRYKRFKLLKNTGSQAPQLMAVAEIYDPNINEIVLREVPDYE